MVRTTGPRSEHVRRQVNIRLQLSWRPAEVRAVVSAANTDVKDMDNRVSVGPSD